MGVLGCPSLQVMGLDGHRAGEEAVGRGVTKGLPTLAGCRCPGLRWLVGWLLSHGFNIWVWRRSRFLLTCGSGRVGEGSRAGREEQGKLCTEAPWGPRPLGVACNWGTVAPVVMVMTSLWAVPGTNSASKGLPLPLSPVPLPSNATSFNADLWGHLPLVSELVAQDEPWLHCVPRHHPCAAPAVCRCPALRPSSPRAPLAVLAKGTGLR